MEIIRFFVVQNFHFRSRRKKFVKWKSLGDSIIIIHLILSARFSLGDIVTASKMVGERSPWHLVKNVLHFSWWFARVHLHFNISIFPCKWHYDRGDGSSQRGCYGGDKNLSMARPLHPLRNPYSSRMYYLSRRFSLARETVANIYRYRFVAFTFGEGKGNIVAQWCFVTLQRYLQLHSLFQSLIQAWCYSWFLRFVRNVARRLSFGCCDNI